MNRSFKNAFNTFTRNLSRTRKIQFISLFALMLLGGVAEIVSLGAIIPFLAVLVDPLQATQTPLVEWVVDILEGYVSEDIRWNITVLFIVAVVVSGLVRFFLIFYIAKFNFGVGEEIAVRVYQHALYQPYEVHMEKNSSEIIGGLNKLDQLIWVIYGLINMVSATLMAVSIVVFLIWIDPILAIIAFSGLGGIYSVVFMVSRKRLANNSIDLSEATDQRIQIVQEGLSGIRDVLLTQTQPLFVSRFDEMNRRMYQAHSSNNIIGPSPRFAVESVGMILIALFAYMSVISGKDISVIIPMLGALALGAQRLMPLVQQSYQGWVQFVGNKDLLFDVAELLRGINDYKSQVGGDKMPGKICLKKNIRMEDVSFRYGVGGRKVLNNLNLIVKKGAKVGFIGPTGCGKSTIVDILMGFIKPTTGNVLIDNDVLKAENVLLWQQQIAHVSQDIFLLDASFMENIAFGASLGEINKDKVKECAEIAKISSVIEETEESYQTKVGERGVRLSGGQRQRVGIARALYRNSPILVLDEATSALDIETEKEIIQSINDYAHDITVIMIAHRTSTLMNCDWIYKIENGSVKLEGCPAEILQGIRNG
jgi:ATP-binding cassette, subfamily B, bacterial PglK